jgi:hypothetical protein
MLVCEDRDGCHDTPATAAAAEAEIPMLQLTEAAERDRWGICRAFWHPGTDSLFPICSSRPRRSGPGSTSAIGPLGGDPNGLGGAWRVSA